MLKALVYGYLLLFVQKFSSWKIGGGVLVFGRINFPNFMGDLVIGKNFMWGHDILLNITPEGSIVIGNNCSINRGSILHSGLKIEIGDNTAIAEYVSIRDEEHNFSVDTGVRGQGMWAKKIEIGSNCWIGRGVYISPGVTLEAGTIVAANSVVMPGVYSSGLLAGAPAIQKKTWRKLEE